MKILSKYKMLAMYDGKALLYHKGKLFTQDIRNKEEVEYLLDLPISAKRKIKLKEHEG